MNYVDHFLGPFAPSSVLIFGLVVGFILGILILSLIIREDDDSASL